MNNINNNELSYIRRIANCNVINSYSITSARLLYLYHAKCRRSIALLRDGI